MVSLIICFTCFVDMWESPGLLGRVEPHVHKTNYTPGQADVRKRCTDRTWRDLAVYASPAGRYSAAARASSDGAGTSGGISNSDRGAASSSGLNLARVTLQY